MRSECASTRRHVMDYAEGRLSGADRVRFESHLEVCLKCRKEYQDARRVTALFASAPRFSAPAGLRGRVMRNLDSGRLKERRRFLPAVMLMRTMEAALILAVIAAGILSGNFVATGLFPRAQDTGAAASTASRGGTLLSYSVDAFDPAPSETVGAEFVMTEDRNEK